MSTKIESVKRDNLWAEDESIRLVQFAGPMRGEGADRKMVQVTMINNDGKIGFIQLTKSEAARLANRLTEWSNGHAVMGDGLDD